MRSDWPDGVTKEVDWPPSTSTKKICSDFSAATDEEANKAAQNKIDKRDRMRKMHSKARLAKMRAGAGYGEAGRAEAAG